MNNDLETYNLTILKNYDVSRFTDSFPVDCVMPGYFSGNDILFIAQNPGLLKEGVKGDELYLRAYEKKEYQRLNDYYVIALKSHRGTYGTFISDIYESDWSRISFTNVFKCPFENNFIPSLIPERELKILRKQIAYLKPKIIVAVGNVAKKAMNDKIIRQMQIPVIHVYHPSYLKRIGQYAEKVKVYKEQIKFVVANNVRS